MIRYCLIIIIFFQSIVCYTQINKYGVPLIRNYSPQEYGAVEQNWAVVKDKRGIMYFGNNDAGVLEYDGINWKKIPVSNKSIVRSLAVDSNGTVFVGAVGEFGYLAPDKFGNLEYVSLSKKLDSNNNNFTAVWKIYIHNNKIYFCTQNYLYIYDYNSVKPIRYTENYCFFTFLVENEIYVGNYLKGLLILKGDSLYPVAGGDFFNLKNIMEIKSLKDNILLIGTNTEGFFKFDLKTGKVLSDVGYGYINSVINESQIYISDLNDVNENYISTINEKGLLITDSNFNIKSLINKNYGLSIDRIFYSYKDKDYDPLWLATEFGISKINCNTNFTHFGDNFGLKGSVNDIIKFNDKLYVATNVGMFYLIYENNFPKFKRLPNISVAWSLSIFSKMNDSSLIVATLEGLFEITKNNEVKSIEERIINIQPRERKFFAYKVYNSKYDNNKLYVGTGSGFVVLSNNNSIWKIEYETDEIKDDVRSFYRDKDGLWVGTTFNGVYCFKNNRLVHYTVENGLPSMSSNYFFDVNNKMLLLSEKGIYKYNNETDKFEPNSFLGKEFSDASKGVFKITYDNKKYWLSLSKEEVKERGLIETKKWLETVEVVNGKIIIDSIPFKILPNLSIDAIYNDVDGITWIGNSKGIYAYNSNYKREFNNKFNSLIRKVTIGQDSIVFYGSYYSTRNNDTNRVVGLLQPEDLKISLDYGNNNIVFEFACPFFDNEEDILYSTYLEGYKENYWSKWSNKNERVFTNLSEGSYKFMVKAKNIYGYESELASFEFTVLPPWYRTIWAYILYGILAIIIIYIIIKIYTRRLELEKIRLEGIVKERTAEVVRQKEDIEKKNETLEQQKIEIERQKDLVIEQKDHIEHIHAELKDSILYAERIQKAILPHPDFAAEILKEYFILFKPKDIVSGDFYFATKINNYIIFAAADCTGHGVPGAFMSMMGVAFLNEIVNDENITEAGQALDMLRENIIKSLQQTGKSGEQKDGMDISFCVIDENTNILQWSGANNPLYIIRKHKENNLLSVKTNGEEAQLESIMTENEYDLFELKPDKMPVAIYVSMNNFTNNVIQLEKGDTIYSFTDGFADQFGGERGKKFMYKPFKKLLLELQNIPMEEQRTELDITIEAWKSHIDPITNEFYEQIDDICIVAKRI